MNIQKERKAAEALLDYYREQLDIIPDELFDKTPPKGGWSFAEVYSHVLQAARMSLVNADRCMNNTCEPTKKGLSIPGRVVMTLGRMPFRVKQPKVLAQKMPALKITKEDARNLLIKTRKRI